MRVPDLRDLAEAGSRAVGRVEDLAARLVDSELRVGVTGLRRSGKTVLVTALIENLLHADRMPFLEVVNSGRFLAARLRPQREASVPRFDFEGHLATLTAPEPRWPEPTRGISQIRIALRFRPRSAIRGRIQGMRTLNLDIVDYPGEWLLDLPMLERDYAQWSRETLDLAAGPARAPLAAAWRDFIAGLDPSGRADDAQARKAAELYTRYLHDCRDSAHLLSLVQPGRFLEPGELAGAPMLQFCPLPPVLPRPGRRSLWAMMEERYTAYQRHVVRRFFTEHFARLDRQIVLVDLLGALSAGPDAVADMQQALNLTLEAFRHGRSTWLGRLLGGRIDKVLFAATKADHVAASQHARLRGLLDGVVADSRNAIRFEGAAVETMAIAAVKSTESVVSEHQGHRLACVRGTPVGRTEPTVLFPGELPETADLIAGAADPGVRRFGALNFLPPRSGSSGRGLPHIRLDQAIDWLIGDYLQ